MRCVLPVYELHQLRPPFFYKHFATSQFENPVLQGYACIWKRFLRVYQKHKNISGIKFGTASLLKKYM
jgi:hypothetical protein